MYWEPNHAKLAIHTLSKRQLEAGKKDYTLDAQRNGVDFYEMVNDPLKGLTVKVIGFLSSEKVVDFTWAGSGDICTVFETEGSKTSINFYMISLEQQAPGQATGGPPQTKQ